MTFFQIINSIILNPIIILFEYIFSVIQKGTNDLVFSIVGLGLVSAFLMIPLLNGVFEKKEKATSTTIKKIIVLIMHLLLACVSFKYFSSLRMLNEISFGKFTSLTIGLSLFWVTFSSIELVIILYIKINKSRVFISILSSFIGLFLLLFSIFISNQSESRSFLILLFICFLIFEFPLAERLITKIAKKRKNTEEKKAANETFNKIIKIQPDYRLILVCGIYLTIFIGVLIPSSVIQSSPQEFIDIYHYSNPIWFIISSALISLGTFVIWFGIAFFLSNERIRSVLILLMCSLSASFTVNYMFFGTNQVILSNSLKYTEDVHFSFQIVLFNLIVFIIIGTLSIVVTNIIGSKAPLAILVTILIMTGINIFNSFSNCIFINKDYSSLEDTAKNIAKEEPYFCLSRNGENVIVFMVDRGLGELIPYFINEKPELIEMYEGFTYYPNTVSFGVSTNVAAPALFGGYEYTPDEINKRESESLRDKHDEALKVMPVIFDNNGFDVTVCDAPMAGYKDVPDMSIYEDYPKINTFITDGYFWNSQGSSVSSRNYRNFFCYSLMKSSPLILQNHLYDNGLYNANITIDDTVNEYYDYSAQVKIDDMVWEGYSSLLMSHYTTLTNMDKMTRIVEDEHNTFLMINNESAHVGDVFFQEPEYDIKYRVDNRQFEQEHRGRYNVDGIELDFRDDWQYGHYQGNMATLLRIGDWLTFLKEQGVYDNTRIIIVSDHGRWMNLNSMYNIDDGSDLLLDIECYYPLLLVKDFNSREFSVSDEFMTNADVPTLAMEGMIENPINPFTGKVINNEEKNNHPQKIMAVHEPDIHKNNGNKFIEGKWLTVEKDMRDKNNWKIVN